MEVITNNENEEGRKNGKTTITIEEGEHLWINTPKGLICVFVGSHYKSITSWVHDMHYAGFFTNNATKKTSPCDDRVKHIQISPKRDSQ